MGIYITVKQDPTYGFVLVDANTGDIIENVTSLEIKSDASQPGMIHITAELIVITNRKTPNESNIFEI